MHIANVANLEMPWEGTRSTKCVKPIKPITLNEYKVVQFSDKDLVPRTSYHVNDIDEFDNEDNVDKIALNYWLAL